MDRVLRYFAENKLLVNLIIIFIVVFGLLSMLNLKQDLYPKVKLNNMLVRVTYPGAAAKDVELNAVVPIEKKLKEINGITKYWSVSNENYAMIFIEIDDKEKDEEQEKTKDEIFRELNNVPDLSKDVDKVTVIEVSPEKIPVYEIGLTARDGYTVTERELNEYADILEDRLKKIDSVSSVEKVGYRDREIKINVNPQKMNKFQIALGEIVNSIKSRNVRITGGTLQTSTNEKTIITIGEFEEPRLLTTQKQWKA